jgi:hypothetical protein
LALNDGFAILLDLDGGDIEGGGASMVTELADQNEGPILELWEDMGLASGER